MSSSLITRLVVTAIVVFSAIGCAPTLYFGIPLTRTYEFERRVPVVVRSEPAGAMIMTADGTELGPAPLVVEEKVRVRRTQRFHSLWMAALGCVIDTGIFATLTNYAMHHPDHDVAVGVVSISELGGCIGLSVRIINHITNYSYVPFQSSSMKGYFDDVVHIDERVIPRTVELMARWDGLADARVKLELPTTGATTLRLPLKYTFDEALILWAKESTSPLTAEKLYRTGNAYRELALHGVHGARKYAIELFTRYLQLHSAAEYANNVRRAIEELERLEEAKR